MLRKDIREKLARFFRRSRQTDPTQDSAAPVDAVPEPDGQPEKESPFVQDQEPAETRPVADSFDDAYVEQRMVGETPSGPFVDQTLVRPKKRPRNQKQQRPQPEPPAPDSGSSPIPAVVPIPKNPDLEEARNLALEDYQPPPPPEEHVSVPVSLVRWFNQLGTGIKILLIGGLLLFVAVMVILVVLWIALFRPQPSPPVSSLPASVPIPVAVILPGGQSYELTNGGVVNGKWSPRGAEWLVDTELPRWVSLPWTRELAAEAATYQEGDVIELRMSNGDHLLYRFQSISEIRRDEIGIFQSNTANLLILLFRSSRSIYPVIVCSP